MLSSTEWTYRYQNSCIQPCHSHFTAIPKRPKCVVFVLLLPPPLRHTFFYFHAISQGGTIADTNIINTPLEPLRPAYGLFEGFIDTVPHFWGEIPQKLQFWGANRRFQAKRAKYWKFHVIETTVLILTKFGTTIETAKWSSWMVPVGAQQIQDGGRPPFWKKALNRHMSATVPPILMKFGMMTQFGPLRGTDR